MAGGIVEIVQHQMDGDEIEGVTLDRRRKDVALPNLGIRNPGLVEIGARHRQHLARHVDADATPVERREDFEQPTGAGAKIEHRLERSLADKLEQCCFHGAVRHMQRADTIPARRILGEISGGAGLPLALDRSQPLEITLDLRVGAADAGDQPEHEIPRRIRIRQPEEGPRPFLVTADQPGLQQQLQVPRYARLRLAKDLGEIGNGKVAVRQHRQDAQPAGFGGRLQCIYHRVESDVHECILFEKHINISLCRFSLSCKAYVAPEQENAACVMIAPGEIHDRDKTHVRDARRRKASGR
jgi:hypothetical protein